MNIDVLHRFFDEHRYSAWVLSWTSRTLFGTTRTCPWDKLTQSQGQWCFLLSHTKLQFFPFVPGTSERSSSGHNVPHASGLLFFHSLLTDSLLSRSVCHAPQGGFGVIWTFTRVIARLLAPSESSREVPCIRQCVLPGALKGTLSKKSRCQQHFGLRSCLSTP